MKYDLTDKAVVLTGGSRGIGRATAIHLAKAGSRVAVIARNEDQLHETVRQVDAAGGKAWPVVGDVTDDDSVRQAIGSAVEALGGIDVFLNIAGITLEKPVSEAVPDDYRRVMETNLLGAVRCNRYALPYLKHSKGVVVHVASIIVTQPFPYLGVYACSKWALAAYSHTLRQEVHGMGVRVLTVYPTVVRTDMLTEEPVLAHVLSQSVERCARAIVKAVKKGRQEAGTALLPLFSRMVFSMHPPWVDRINRLFLPEGY